MPPNTLFKRIVLLAFYLLFLPAFINSQEKDEKLAEQRKLEQKILHSESVAEKIQNTSRLAAFYFTQKNNVAGDSLIDIITLLATKSGKKEDIFASYQWSGNAYLSSANRDKGLPYAQKAVDYATKEKMVNEEIIALLNLARQYTLPGSDFSKANEYFNRIDLNKNGVHDSSRYNYYYRKSAFFFNQKKILDGIKNLFTARNFAEKINDPKKLGQVNQFLGDNYSQVKEYEKAISYYHIAKKYYEKIKDTTSLLFADNTIANAYVGLKNYPAAKEYFETVIKNAEIAHNSNRKYFAVNGLWAMYYYQNDFLKAAEEAKKYKLVEYYSRTGDSMSLYSIKGVFSEIAGDHDSADWYYRKVIALSYSSKLKINTAFCLFNYGEYLKKYNRYAEALPPMESALSKFDSLHDISRLPAVYQNLDSIYTALGDYKNALSAKRNYDLYRDSLDNQSKIEDILKEEIAAEEESMAKTEEAAKKATERKHDIQYRFIILGAILLLIGLLAIGFFHPPKWLIRGLAFVSFIFIFEFIILILDSKLHHWFHGAPLPILSIKVLIACLLVPLHHITEKKVIHFLQSKKLHRLKTVFKDEPAKS